jgi:hypothetical protein
MHLALQFALLLKQWQAKLSIHAEPLTVLSLVLALDGSAFAYAERS